MNDSQNTQELVESMRQEHEELRDLLGSLNRRLADRLEGVASVAEMMASLDEHVQTHFNQEEATGLFDAVIDRAPRLADRIADLRTEHQQLLSAVRELKQAADQGDGSTDWWQGLNSAFHSFSKELMHHENSETDVLMEAYTDDIGAAD